MSKQLLDNLNEIKNQKDTYLLPENLRKDITCLGITGTLEAGSARSNIKIFSSKEAMDADTDKQPGDVAILYDYTEIPVTSEMVINGFILPKELPISLITSSDQQLFTGGHNGGDVLKINSDSTITLNIESFDGGGAGTLTLYTKSDNKLVRNATITEYFSFDDYRVSMMSTPPIAKWSNTTTLQVSDISNDIWNHIKPVTYNYFNTYQLKDGSYNMLPTYLTALPHHIVKGVTALTASGKTTGTLDLSTYTNKNVKFSNGIPGYNLTDKTYNNSLAVVLLDTNFSYALGDKRFIAFYRRGDGMGVESINAIGIYDDPDTIIQSSDNGHNFALIPNRIFKTRGTCWVSQASGETIKNCYPVTGFTDNTETFYLYDNPFVIYTNCKVIDKDGNVLKEAGPKASTTLKGQHYVNLFGEIVEGTYEPNYTELGTISPTEYDTAVTTSEDILGTITE